MAIGGQSRDRGRGYPSPMVPICLGIFSFGGIQCGIFIHCAMWGCGGIHRVYVHMSCHDGDGKWELLLWRCKCAYDYAIDHEWAYQVGY